MIDGGQLKDRVAIVTGAASGLGRATARLFARHGAKVVLADVAEDAGRRVAAEVDGDFLTVDVGVASAVDHLVAWTVERHGRLDVMVNNAGVCPLERLIDVDDALYRRILAVNLDGVFFGMRAAGRVMQARNPGRSSMSHRPAP